MTEPSFADTIVYQSTLVRIGAFRCDREYPGFQNTGPANNDCFVFPRTAVLIEHEDAPSFVANPNVVTFYNRSQHYLRHGISERGDRCDWFGVSRELALDAVRSVDPSVEASPFRRHRGRCDPPTFLRQRCLFDAVSKGAVTDAVAVDEMVVMLLIRVLGGTASLPQGKNARTLAHEVECLLTTRFDQPLTLPEIARHAGVSVYHLCRTFRQATGLALHQYIRQLRIRHGLESVCETSSPLSRIAVDLGFTHHSHFTNAFRRDFAVTPSQLRASQSRC